MNSFKAYREYVSRSAFKEAKENILIITSADRNFLPNLTWNMETMKIQKHGRLQQGKW